MNAAAPLICNCPDCNGWGLDENDLDCPMCNGSGDVVANPNDPTQPLLDEHGYPIAAPKNNP